MKNKLILPALGCVALMTVTSCSDRKEEPVNATNPTESVGSGQSGVSDDVSSPNVVKVAVASADHTTLVKAVTAADLVNALSNNGPFTVFAPNNAAFDALPSGALDDLLKPEKKDALADILQYHVFVGVLAAENLSDGQSLGMVNGGNVTVHARDGKQYINDAVILASVPAANGIVHVIDKVLLPPSSK